MQTTIDFQAEVEIRSFLCISSPNTVNFTVLSDRDVKK